MIGREDDPRGEKGRRNDHICVPIPIVKSDGSKDDYLPMGVADKFTLCTD